MEWLSKLDDKLKKRIGYGNNRNTVEDSINGFNIFLDELMRNKEFLNFLRDKVIIAVLLELKENHVYFEENSNLTVAIKNKLLKDKDFMNRIFDGTMEKQAIALSEINHANGCDTENEEVPTFVPPILPYTPLEEREKEANKTIMMICNSLEELFKKNKKNEEVITKYHVLECLAESIFKKWGMNIFEHFPVPVELGGPNLRDSRVPRVPQSFKEAEERRMKNRRFGNRQANDQTIQNTNTAKPSEINHISVKHTIEGEEK
jgi:hypothetical protein